LSISGILLAVRALTQGCISNLMTHFITYMPT